ncbi:hypothetical protein G7Z17_g1401 [Cylindrodendrum hubeiense]|uniref:Amidohydrolase-related domain-containing protein n=1 Tax=Cylindrodendrum hubeiense TaxID=595255 RepID=A0A9P5HKU0_9HYPO|nr:hypothetical protein G7Z17_g1401 [Cylindrodendrum hubeiense]
MATKSGILSLEPPPYSDAQPSTRRSLRRRRRLVGTLLLIFVAGFTTLIHLDAIGDFVARSAPTTQDAFSKGLDKCYETRNRIGQNDRSPSKDRQNLRWNAITGQQSLIVIKNATLFDGEYTLEGAFDIAFESGIIRSVTPTTANEEAIDGAHVINAYGRFVTPGLVDMHSHHLLLPFPGLSAASDISERPLMGPITPFVRALDAFKPYDPAIKIIASGGVTSSLILPGSANIVGGEAYVVKNLPVPGEDGEPVVEELLLDHGLPETSRQRYLKMACGENPKNIYHNSRLGLAWLLREHLEQAQELRERQDAWCQAAFDIEGASFSKARRVSNFLDAQGKRPDELKLETSLALLRGELNINVHCYEPEDFESMLSVLHEFGVHPQAFHHALEAWQVPEFLKRLEENITIATFAENGLFKAEAYDANLRGGKILNDHGLPVAFKSDHTGEGNFAKYLAYQAAVAHSFGLPEDKSLQSVTSIPARSIQQGHRIGYARAGYDADLVIWDDHPLQVGATPTKVFIDGRDVLGAVTNSIESKINNLEAVGVQKAPAVRPTIAEELKGHICASTQNPRSNIVFTGIQKVLIDTPLVSTEDVEDYVLVVEDGQITCLGGESACLSEGIAGGFMKIALEQGYITPGLVAFGNKLGIQSIPSEGSTGDGKTGSAGDALNEEKRVHFAKYGVHLHGRAFTRARIGGITKAVTAPLFGGGIIQGVSVGLRLGENATILDGGIWKDDVALHLAVGQSAKGDDTPTVSSGIERLRQLLQAGQIAKTESDSVYAQAANGSLPLVVEAYNELILVKRDFPSINLIIYGGHGAPFIAKPLADAGIPVILTGNRGGPTSWEKKNALVGPPQTEPPAKILLEAGVLLGLAVASDSKVHGLAQEGRWAGKYAGLSDKQAIALVSTNIDAILGTSTTLDAHQGVSGQHYKGDFVVWEGDPLRGEGSVVLAIQDDGKIADCWPDTEDAVL